MKTRLSTDRIPPYRQQPRWQPASNPAGNVAGGPLATPPAKQPSRRGDEDKEVIPYHSIETTA